MRHIGAAVLCVAVGALLTVLTAWAGALWGTPVRPGARGVYLAGDTWPVPVPRGWPPPHHGQDAVGVGITATQINAYTGIDETHRILVVRAGWPLRALAFGQYGRGGFGAVGPAATGWRTAWVERLAEGIVVDSTPKASALDLRRSLPLWPLWGGLAVNTAVYAGVAWVGLVGLGVRRRRRRRRRGWCPACGYDMAGLAACPECGAGARPG